MFAQIGAAGSQTNQADSNKPNANSPELWIILRIIILLSIFALRSALLRKAALEGSSGEQLPKVACNSNYKGKRRWMTFK